MAQQALSGIKVLDLTHYVAGPYCTKLLAGYGADVIKIERPRGGDALRRSGPYYENQPGLERSIPFLWFNTGKRSLTLDLKSERGAALFKELVKDADVLVENFEPRVMASLGLDYETLRAINPRLVMTSISNFGQTGPYRDWQADEITLYAMSGGMHLTGSADQPPLNTGHATTQYNAALHAYSGTLLALLHAQATGEGQHVDVAILEAGVDTIEIAMVNHLRDGVVPRRKKHMMVPWSIYPCSDGYAVVICGPFRHWVKGVEMFEVPELCERKYHHVRDRAKDYDKIEQLILPWLSRQKKRDVFERGQRHGLAFGYLASFAEVFASEQLEARGFFEKIDHPEVGEQTYPGDPYNLTGTPWKNGRAPLLGEHTREVLSERLGLAAGELEALTREGVIA